MYNYNELMNSKLKKRKGDIPFCMMLHFVYIIQNNPISVKPSFQWESLIVIPSGKNSSRRRRVKRGISYTEPLANLAFGKGEKRSGDSRIARPRSLLLTD